VPNRKEDIPCFQISSPGSNWDEGVRDGSFDAEEHAMQATIMIAKMLYLVHCVFFGEIDRCMTLSFC